MQLSVKSKHFLFLLILFSTSFTINALESNDSAISKGSRENGSYKRLTIIPTGFHYEMLGNKNNSIIISAKVSQNFGGGYRFGHLYYFYQIRPAFNISYRYYYNLNKRLRKKRIVDFRSLNYFGLLMENQGQVYDVRENYRDKTIKSGIFNKNFFKREVSYIGPIWGAQRCFGKNNRMFWSAEFGIGYNIFKSKALSRFENYSTLSIIGDLFSIGFVL